MGVFLPEQKIDVRNVVWDSMGKCIDDHRALSCNILGCPLGV